MSLFQFIRPGVSILMMSLFMVCIAEARQADPEPLNSIGLSYTHDNYSEVFDSWHLFALEYQRNTSFGPLLFRANLANRFNRDGVQFEVDAYPEIGEDWYAYLNAGYSGSDIFPEFRFGSELYRAFEQGWELSAGFRYLSFEATDVTVLTGSVSRYPANWYLSLRPYISFVGDDTGRSITVTARRYFGGPETHVSINAGFGTTLEERQILESVSDVAVLRSQFIGIEGVRPVSRTVELTGGLRFTNQELVAIDDYAQIYTFRAGIKYRF